MAMLNYQRVSLWKVSHSAWWFSIDISSLVVPAFHQWDAVGSQTCAYACQWSGQNQPTSDHNWPALFQAWMGNKLVPWHIRWTSTFMKHCTTIVVANIQHHFQRWTSTLNRNCTTSSFLLLQLVGYPSCYIRERDRTENSPGNDPREE